jgi:hypothetical protein
MNFEKLESYFGQQTFFSNEIQFELPNVKNLDDLYSLEEKHNKTERLLDAYYQTLKSDILYNFSQVSSVFIETEHRSYIVCSLNGFMGLHELKERWKATKVLENIYVEMKENGTDYIGDFVKINHEFLNIEDHYKEAIELIENIEVFIAEKVVHIMQEIKEKI